MKFKFENWHIGSGLDQDLMYMTPNTIANVHVGPGRVQLLRLLLLGAISGKGEECSKDVVMSHSRLSIGWIGRAMAGDSTAVIRKEGNNRR